MLYQSVWQFLIIEWLKKKSFETSAFNIFDFPIPSYQRTFSTVSLLLFGPYHFEAINDSCTPACSTPPKVIQRFEQTDGGSLGFLKWLSVLLKEFLEVEIFGTEKGIESSSFVQKHMLRVDTIVFHGVSIIQTKVYIYQ